MPRVASILDQFLAQHGVCFGQAQEACLAILLAFYFGWRSSTVSALERRHIVYMPELHIFRFTEAFSKGSFASL